MSATVISGQTVAAQKSKFVRYPPKADIQGMRLNDTLVQRKDLGSAFFSLVQPTGCVRKKLTAKAMDCLKDAEKVRAPLKITFAPFKGPFRPSPLSN